MTGPYHRRACVAISPLNHCVSDLTCRTISYCSGLFTMTLNLLWLLPFYNVGGTRNGWFTIFVDLYVLTIQPSHMFVLHMSNAEPVPHCVCLVLCWSATGTKPSLRACPKCSSP